MPHGSDPRRRSDQQSPDSGSSLPPTWWTALEEGRLPNEGPQLRRGQGLHLRLLRLARHLGAPAVALAVVAAVVVAGFGYEWAALGLGAAVLVSLLAVTLLGVGGDGTGRRFHRLR